MRGSSLGQGECYADRRVPAAERYELPELSTWHLSELQFVPPAGTARIDAEVGLADAAYAPANPSPTDGVTVEIFELRPDGAHRTLYRRDLDPARKLADRGPQSIRLDDLAPLTGRVVFRISPGPKNNLTSDWAYWGRIEFR